MTIIKIIGLIIAIGSLLHYVFIKRNRDVVTTPWSIGAALWMGPPAASWQYKLAHVIGVVLFLSAVVAYSRDLISDRMVIIAFIIPLITFSIAAWFGSRK